MVWAGRLAQVGELMRDETLYWADELIELALCGSARVAGGDQGRLFGGEGVGDALSGLELVHEAKAVFGGVVELSEVGRRRIFGSPELSKEQIGEIWRAWPKSSRAEYLVRRAWALTRVPDDEPNRLLVANYAVRRVRLRGL